MITCWNLKKSSSLRLVDSKVMWAAEMIDEEVFTQIMVNFYEISIDDLGVLIAEKITKVLDILNPELGSLSESFWKRSLKDPIEIEEALAALLLNFLQNFISQRVHFKTIIKNFALLTKASFVKILRRVICSQELLSFNISALLLFSQFKYIENIPSEFSIYSTRASLISSFNSYVEEFKNFLFSYSMFVEYFESLRSRDTSEPFEQIIDQILNNIVIVDRSSFTSYNIDGLTTYDRKIYLIKFETGSSDLDKGATFYILLHELCHLFWRVPCNTWKESFECKTPETLVGRNTFSEPGDIFEIIFFGKRHKFLNLSTCIFLTSFGRGMIKEDFKKRFIELNKTQESVSVGLKRRNKANTSNDATSTFVMLKGCAFRNHRN